MESSTMIEQIDLFTAPPASPAAAALDLDRLAADYSDTVRELLTPAQLADVRRRDDHGLIDPLADYLDFDDALHGALVRQLGDDFALTDFIDAAQSAVVKARTHGYGLMRVLIGCEFSGRVRDEFRALGHDATSCDLLPSEGDPAGKHYQGDVRDIIGDGYKLAVFHPPCTYLCASALWRARPEHDVNYPERKLKGEAALDFVRELMDAPIPHWALENPKGMIGTAIRPGDQMVQPYEFGDDASKQTYLWLKNLPALVADPADYVQPRKVKHKGKLRDRWANQTPCGADRTSKGPNRWKIRSLTFPGIARAMAAQWGGLYA